MNNILRENEAVKAAKKAAKDAAGAAKAAAAPAVSINTGKKPSGPARKVTKQDSINAAKQAGKAAAGAAKAAGSAAVSVKNESRNRSIIRMTESDLHQIIKESVNRVLEDYNPFDNDDFEEWDRTNVSPISDEEYNEIMRMNPMQNSSYIFNKIGFNKWNGFVSRWGKENPEECERFWQSMMAF